MKQFIILFIFLTASLCIAKPSDINQQKSDSIHAPSFIKKNVVPVSLITLGVLLNKSVLEKNIRTAIVKKYGTNLNTKIDDVAQFIPVVQLFSADILGVKAKNHWFDQGKYLFMANALSSTVTFYLKKWIGKTRPNGADNLSFPSGHTTFAFTNATVLYEEFKETSPILAVSGYGFAVTTGSFRMLNNKHWFSDVLIGAGIGILATKIIYQLKPLANFNPFKKSKNITLYPTIIDDKKGVYLVYRF